MALVMIPSVSFAQIPHTGTTYPLEITEDKKLFIQIKSDYPLSEHQIKIIKNAILSEDSVTKNGNKFFKGWSGAIKELSQKHTLLNLPTTFVFTNSSQKEETVTILLTQSRNDQGFSGFTKYAKSSDRIWNPEIIIYQSNILNDADLESVVKHEFGHALGLGHSLTPGDLMYNTVDSTNSFISQLDEDSLYALYDEQL